MRANDDPWSLVAERLGVDLFLDVQPDPHDGSRGRGATRRRSLTDALRSAISDGRLTAGTRLPPYRSLAADTGLSRGTVAAAYQELIAEGWLVARQGSGTRVADNARRLPSNDKPSPPIADSSHVVRHDFSLGQPTKSLFPRTEWIASTRRVMTDAPDDALGRGHPQGSATLRSTLAAYLGRARGVRTHPEHIVVTTSVSRALELLSRTVFDEMVAVEEYGLAFHRQRIEFAGSRTIPVPVDAHGARVDAMTEGVRTVVLTPSHQYPTGVALSPERRMTAIDQARATGGLIVEDDYDGELRYDREPVGAMQSLGPDVTVYLGSVSKSLSPAVRIAWLVLPPALVGPVIDAKGAREREPDASMIDQLILADLIESGAYDRHIRRSRQSYRSRRDLLTSALADAGITLPGIAAGLHAVIPVAPQAEDRIREEAVRRGFALATLGAFRHPAAPDRDDAPGGVVAGFGTPTASAYAADIAALVRLVSDFA